MIGLLKGARDLEARTYLASEKFSIFEKRTGARDVAIRAMTAATYRPDLTINTRSSQGQEAIHRKSKWVKYTSPVPVARMVESAILQEAMNIVGPYRRKGQGNQ